MNGRTFLGASYGNYLLCQNKCHGGRRTITLIIIKLFRRRRQNDLSQILPQRYYHVVFGAEALFISGLSVALFNFIIYLYLPKDFCNSWEINDIACSPKNCKNAKVIIPLILGLFFFYLLPSVGIEPAMISLAIYIGPNLSRGFLQKFTGAGASYSLPEMKKMLLPEVAKLSLSLQTGQAHNELLCV